MELLAIARRYVAGGLSVIPVRADGTKRPDARLLPREVDDKSGEEQPTWKPFQTRLPTEAELVDWFGSGRQVGIAIICGRVSGCLEVLDFDSFGAFESWQAALATELPGLLERLPQVRTPSGGMHVYYRLPEHLLRGNQKLARMANGETLVETRGEGGYVLAPGSPPACHSERGIYLRVAGPHLDEVPLLESRP